MADHDGTGVRWWGTYQLPPEQSGRWQIGPLALWISHRTHEWDVSLERTTDIHEATVQTEIPTAVPIPELPMELERFGVSGASTQLRLMPKLADRSVVVRPAQPFHLLPDAEVVMFVSTPLWVELEVGETSQALTEIPIIRPSDTWFGQSTRNGELCYASRTAGRLAADALPRLPHRAITPVCLRNKTQEPLFLERINVPVGHLSLYETTGGRLWTEHMVMEHGVSRDVVRVPPGRQTARNYTPVARPRLGSEENVLVRALGSLFG